jgi:hypothetical protein
MASSIFLGTSIDPRHNSRMLALLLTLSSSSFHYREWPSEMFSLTDLLFDGYPESAARIESNWARASIVRCRFSSCGNFDSTGGGISFLGLNITVVRCVFESCRGNTGSAVYLDSRVHAPHEWRLFGNLGRRGSCKCNTFCLTGTNAWGQVTLSFTSSNITSNEAADWASAIAVSTVRRSLLQCLQIEGNRHSNCMILDSLKDIHSIRCLSFLSNLCATNRSLSFRGLIAIQGSYNITDSVFTGNSVDYLVSQYNEVSTFRLSFLNCYFDNGTFGVWGLATLATSACFVGTGVPPQHPDCSFPRLVTPVGAATIASTPVAAQSTASTPIVALFLITISGIVVTVVYGWRRRRGRRMVNEGERLLPGHAAGEGSADALACQL